MAPSIRRRDFLAAAAAGALSVATGRGPAAAARRPNILLIVSDDQGYNDLGCCGGKEIKTPPAWNGMSPPRGPCHPSRPGEAPCRSREDRV